MQKALTLGILLIFLPGPPPGLWGHLATAKVGGRAIRCVRSFSPPFRPDVNESIAAMLSRLS